MQEIKKKVLEQIIPNSYLPEKLQTSVSAYANVIVYNKKSNENIVEVNNNCAQDIYTNFLKVTANNSNIIQVLSGYKDLILECNITHSLLYNKTEYSNEEFIDKYIALLNSIGCNIKVAHLKNKSLLSIDYEELERTEAFFLIFTWQAIRNLILPYFNSLPGIFIKLAKTLPDANKMMLYQLSYRYINFNILTALCGSYPIDNYNSFIKSISVYINYDTRPTKSIFNVETSKINTEITNIREFLSDKYKSTDVNKLNTLCKVFNKNSKLISEEEYNEQRNALISCKTKRKLILTIENILQNEK